MVSTKFYANPGMLNKDKYEHQTVDFEQNPDKC
jgi:hypothetical protein